MEVFLCLWKEEAESLKEGLQTMQRKLCARYPPTPTDCVLLPRSFLHIHHHVIHNHHPFLFSTPTQPDPISHQVSN
jgi:hypothetical protein